MWRKCISSEQRTSSDFKSSWREKQWEQLQVCVLLLSKKKAQPFRKVFVHLFEEDFKFIKWSEESYYSTIDLENYYSTIDLENYYSTIDLENYYSTIVLESYYSTIDLENANAELEPIWV